jgi:hypothetical protein
MVNQAFYPCLGVFIAVHLMKNVKLSLENCICNVMKMLPYSSISKEISCQKRHTSIVISTVLGRSCAQAFFFHFPRTKYFSESNEDIQNYVVAVLKGLSTNYS